MTALERQLTPARTASSADVAHAFCPCQAEVPLAARRSVCDTVRGHGEESPPDADRCVVCVDLVAGSGRWCGHG